MATTFVVLMDRLGYSKYGIQGGLLHANLSRGEAGWGNSALPRIETPVAYAVFPKEVIASPESWIDQTYNVVQRTEMPKGGHFAALEQPDLLIKDIRIFFAKLKR